MDHHDIDHETKTSKELSQTFENEIEKQMIINGLLWLGGRGER
jgi:hypothetical protein